MADETSTSEQPAAFPPPPPSEETAAVPAAMDVEEEANDADDLELHSGGGNAPPAAADAAFFGIPVNGVFVGCVALALAVAVFFPLLYSERTETDKFALLCFVPTIAFALFAGIRHRGEVHFRQLVVRFAGGFLVLTPFSWVGALICIGFALVIVSVIAALLPLPGVVVVTLFVVCVFGSITTMEMIAMWLVLTKHDSIQNMSADNGGNPRQYPFFAASIALGMSTASTYYIILFLRALIDEGNRQACASWAERGATSGPGMYGNSTVEPLPEDGASNYVRAFAALAAHGHNKRNSTAQCHEQLSSGDLVVILVAAVCLIQPMMVLASYHIGLVAARIQLHDARISAVGAILPSVAFRTFFLASVIVGPIFLGPFVLLLLLITVVGFFGFIKRYEHKMPRAYLDRVGYLNLFGYGALPQGDDTAGGGGADTAAAHPETTSV